MEEKPDKKEETPASSSNEGISRRTFIKNTGLVTGGIVGGSILGGFVGNQWMRDTASEQKEATPEKEVPAVDLREARMFFTRSEDFNVLSHAVERIFPEDDNGPGAIALGIPYFIDRQLAGAWGNNTNEYMKGPFKAGEATQGFQSALTRGEIFLQGVRKINAVSQSEYGEAFYDLDEEQQNSILTTFQNGDVELQGVDSPTFFAMLRQGTIEGAYADPLYGGNKNMDGWRMKEYPGPVMSYINVVEDEEFTVMEPISLHDHHRH